MIQDLINISNMYMNTRLIVDEKPNGMIRKRCRLNGNIAPCNCNRSIRQWITKHRNFYPNTIVLVTTTIMIITLLLNMLIITTQSFTMQSKILAHGRNIIIPRRYIYNQLDTSVRDNDNDDGNGNDNNRNRYIEAAARLRLEAEKMDLELTISKIQTIQKSIDKLIKKQQQQQKSEDDDDDDISNNKKNGNSSSKISDSIVQLEDQIRMLQKKLGNDYSTIGSSYTLQHNVSDSQLSTASSTGTYVATATSIGKSDVPLVVTMDNTADRIVLSSSGSVIASSTSDAIATSRAVPTSKRKATTSTVKSTTTKSQNSIFLNSQVDNDDEMIYGFDKDDLELYLPVAIEIERTIVNATTEERLKAFRATPALQTHFQQKLSQLLIEPIQDMNRLEELKQEYLDSTSSKEKELIKRQIDTIHNSLENDGPFLYSDSVYRPIPELSDDEMQVRINAMQELPDILQTIYKQRYNLDSNATLTLAILLDHYEIQLQLLEQIKSLPQPFPTEVRDQIIKAIESLPLIVRDHIASVVGLKPEEKSYTVDDLIVELSKTNEGDDDDENWWDQVVATTSSAKSSITSTKQSSLTAIDWSILGDISTFDDDENNDIEIIDRSRYVHDFYPAIARMEKERISLETVEQISRTMFDKKSFMVTNKVEQVVGGYYIRGRNLLDEDGSGHQLMIYIQDKLRILNATFDEEFEYFYIRDPAPITDEELELEYRNDPLFVITRKNITRFYNSASPLTTILVTVAAFASMGIFAADVFHLESSVLGQLESPIALPDAALNEIDLTLLLSNLAQIVTPLTFIQLAHESGHRFIAWKDKVTKFFFVL
jgi:hypothetical protein